MREEFPGSPEGENPSLHEALLHVAERYAVSLTEERLARLITTRDAAYTVRGCQYKFNWEGLIVTTWYDEPGALIDFLPEGEMTRPTEKDRRDKYALDFLVGAQNFFLLAEAGLLERPSYFYGATNPSMNEFARRHYGAEVDESGGLRADYELVKGLVFSPSALAAEAMLRERLGQTEEGA